MDHELRKGKLATTLQGLWTGKRLENLLSNATRTFFRLDTIFTSVSRERCAFGQMRAYYHSNRYDKEVAHLRLRIGTYVTSLSIPILIGTFREHEFATADSARNDDIQFGVLADKLELLNRRSEILVKVSSGVRHKLLMNNRCSQ